MKHAVITFGCRVNQADSLGFEEELLASGSVAASAEAADVVVVNTCSVTASADQGARQTIRRIARINPGARIVVTGCYATRAHDEVSALPNVQRVVCNDDKPRLLSFLLRPERAAAATAIPANPPFPVRSTAERFGDGDGSCGASIQPGVAGRTAFTLRVQTGCAEACTYCIIPDTRGAPRSLPMVDVLADVARVCAAGFKEIALTGVHLGSYGRDLGRPRGLSELLHTLDSTYGQRAQDDGPEMLFRISSLEPMDCTPDVVALARDSTCIAPHFHLPLQHASDRMLRAMRRPYNLEYYAGLVDAIRREIPHASIGSDIIVGFPGESDDDFDQLAAYLERSPLTHLHVFPYSDRPGTAASKLGARAPGAVIKERGARVRQIGATLARAFLDSQLGTVHRALTLEDGTLAVTGNYLKMRIPPGLSRNEWIDVRLIGTKPNPAGEVLS